MSERPLNVLLADSEPELVQPLERVLTNEGYCVFAVHDGLHAISCAKNKEIHLFVLDVLLPVGDGLWVCERLRKKPAYSSTPILLMTARPDAVDCVTALDSGGDDYLVKPFSVEEFKARVRALVRRSQHDSDDKQTSGAKNGQLTVGPFTLISEPCGVRIGDQVILLTPREYDLMRYLALHYEEIVSAHALLEEVWGYPEGSDCTGLVRWFVKSLRRKIEPDPLHPRYLRVISRQGYVLSCLPSDNR